MSFLMNQGSCVQIIPDIVLKDLYLQALLNVYQKLNSNVHYFFLFPRIWRDFCLKPFFKKYRLTRPQKSIIERRESRCPLGVCLEFLVSLIKEFKKGLSGITRTILLTFKRKLIAQRKETKKKKNLGQLNLLYMRLAT